MSSTLSRLANVLTASESPYTSFVHIHEKEPRPSVAAKSERLANAYSKELTLRTAFSSHKLSLHEESFSPV